MINTRTTLLVSTLLLGLSGAGGGYADDQDYFTEEGLRKMVEAADARERAAYEELHKTIKAAERGEREAEYKLGAAYQSGRILDKDEAAAVKWYRKSAQQGYVPAQEEMGDRYFTGRGVEKDLGMALSWYRRASIQGSEPAKLALAHMYANGEGVGQNLHTARELYVSLAKSDSPLSRMRATLALVTLYEKHYPEQAVERVRWMERAYEVGNGHLRGRLIKAYTDGELVPPNDEKAFRYLSDYSRARATPDEDFLLAVMYEEGRGVKKNQSKADEIFAYLLRAGHPDAVIRQTVREKLPKAQCGNAQAQYEIAQAYLSKDKLSKQEIDEVISWLEKASNKKHREARVTLALFYADARADQRYDNDKAIAILEAMAAEGDAEIQVGLFLTYEGYDDAKALYWLKAAVDQGHSAGQYHLANAYFEGKLGLEQDLNKALEWYEKAATAGLPAAIA